MPVIIRPFDHAEGSPDWAGLRALFEKVYGPDVAGQRMRALRWVTLDNPADAPGERRYVADDDGRIAGTLGRMPVCFAVKGRPILVRYSHDLFVDPDYRGQKLAQKLVDEVPRRSECPTGGLWMTGPSYTIHQKGGWKAMTPTHAQMRILDPSALLARRMPGPLAGIAGGALRGLLAIASVDAWGAGPTGYAVEEVERFGPEADALWAEAAPLLEVSAVRDEAYLRWRFERAPNTRYVKLVARRAGKMRGYLALRFPEGGRAGSAAVGVDFLACPDEPDTITALFREALARARATCAPGLLALTTCAPFRRRLRRLGFLQAPHLQTFVLHNLAGHPDEALLSDTAHWYLTFTDSDGDMWTGAQPPERV